MSLFRYAGNKNKLVNFYRSPPKGTNRIVEVFAGSMTYAFSYKCNILGIELNPRIVSVYNLIMYGNLYNTLEKFNKYSSHFDLRNCPEFSPAEKDYISLSSGSLMSGHLGKNIVYNLEKPLRPLIENAYKTLQDYYRHGCSIEVQQGSCYWLYTSKDVSSGDLVFIDPPYGSSSNTYGIKESQTAILTQYIKHLAETGVPIIFTYGDYAPEIFPEFYWEKVAVQTVTKTRKKSQKRETRICMLHKF